MLDIKTRQVVTLPGSDGLYSPRWSPDGRYVAAMPADQLSVVLYDFETQHWVELAKGSAEYPTWSKDGKYLYFLRVPKDPAVLCVRISDRKLEEVVDLTNSRMGGHFGFWLGLAPDDSPLCCEIPEVKKFTFSTGKCHERDQAANSGSFSKSTMPTHAPLTLWKNAEPGIPVLKQAKAEYAKLQ